MRLVEIERRYPEAYGVVRGIMRDLGISHDAVESLSAETLRCVDAGLIPRADLRELLEFKRKRGR